MTFALNCRTMSRPPSCTFCTLFCYIFTLFSLLKTNPSSIKWMLQQALIKHIFFFIISQFCCLGHSERWLLAGCFIKTKIQSEMPVVPVVPVTNKRYELRGQVAMWSHGYVTRWLNYVVWYLGGKWLGQWGQRDQGA